jgi:predicted ribosome quality control (RQC) complex YloA/Tae2 family protein
MEVKECFTQNKDELILGLSDDHNEQYIRANLAPVNTCLSFPEQFKRSKKNNVSLFKEIIGEKINSVNILEFERAFTLKFSSGKVLLFKMHGNRSNVLYYNKEEPLPLTIFRNELKEDAHIIINQLRKPISPDKKRFIDMEGNASQFLPTLGKEPRNWLKEHGYLEANLEEKWELMVRLMDMLDHPQFSIVKEQEQYIFTLLPVEQPIFSTSNPIEAANEYFRYSVIYQTFEKEKNELIKSLEGKRKKTQAYIDKTMEKLYDLENESAPNHLADIIMANLHQIPSRSEKVVLYDFYNDRDIEVAIKKGLSPQKHAENLYRKAKNRKIEIEQVNKNLLEKTLYLQELGDLLDQVDRIQYHRDLKAFLKDNNLVSGAKEPQENVPFKRFEIEGFELIIGKSAKSNDELLRRYTWKDDLWLHAKDVSGSHTILKSKAGQSFPSPTIERAAEMAAYYSKNKNETLAAVIYTPCKYVRKVKGSAPGAVMVDREKVIMVQPKGPQS